MLSLGKSLFTFFSSVGRRLAWAFDHWASENKKLHAWQENLLVRDDRTALFQALLMAWRDLDSRELSV